MSIINRKIKAAVVRNARESFKIEELDIRAPKDNEVLIKITATGLCHTDLIARDQYYPVSLPAILGHEGAGIVEDVGPNVKNLKQGDHVVLTYGACNHCTPCLEGHSSYCQNFFDLNFVKRAEAAAVNDANKKPVFNGFFSQSSFSTYALATENNTIKVDNDVDLNILGPLGCGIQTGAGAVINSLKVSPGSSFVCFGAGAVGLSAVMAAKIAGATTIIAVDIVQSRLDLALKLGATHVVNPLIDDVVALIREITDGGANFALESTGRPAILTQGVEILGVRGALGIVGAPKLGTKAEFDVNELLLSGKTIRGIVEGDSVPNVFIPQLIELYKQGRFPFDKLIKFYSLDQINIAAADSENGSAIKPVITFL